MTPRDCNELAKKIVNGVSSKLKLHKEDLVSVSPFAQDHTPLALLNFSLLHLLSTLISDSRVVNRAVG